MRVVGAGLPRTGTTSLKAALERLLGAPCYHMHVLAENLDDGPVWRDAFRGSPPDWDAFLGGYAAGVDWPVSCFWRELSEAYPDAIVLLSRRATAEEWYASMAATVLRGALLHRESHARPPWTADATEEQRQAMDEMWRTMGGGLLADPGPPDAVMAGYERHLAEVRAQIPAARLVEWAPGDGWEPLCAALDLPVPDEPFPHHNSRAEMTGRMREHGML